MSRRHVEDPQATDDTEVTYYDRPVIKEPVWIWSVPAYFYVGGVASGTALLGAVAQLWGREDLDDLIDRCRDVAAVGGALGTALLIHDLGRPSRFLNMLRVFRPSSAMSVGSWTLAAASGATAASAVAPRVLPGPVGRVAGDVAGLGAGALAPALGTYTAVLLSDTAVPLWRAVRRELPFLFAAGALTGAASALELVGVSGRGATIVRRIGLVSKAAELAAHAAVERAADDVPRVGRPLHQGVSGALWQGAEVLTAGSLVAALLPLPRRWRQVVGAVLGTLGAVAVRFALFQGGRSSARDPRATFRQQRERHRPT